MKLSYKQHICLEECRKSVVLKNGDTSKSLSAKFNMSKMRAGVEGATTQWDGNMSVTEYRELGVNTTGVVVVAVAFFAKVLGPKTAIA